MGRGGTRYNQLLYGPLTLGRRSCKLYDKIW